MRLFRIFSFSTEYSDEYSDYSKFILFSKKERADYCDYSEYSVSKANIRPSMPIIHFKNFFSQKKHADYCRLFKNFFFFLKKRADYCDYSEYSVSKLNIRPSNPIIHFFYFFIRKNMPIIAIIPNIQFLN